MAHDPKKTSLIEKLSIFSNTFNKRPDNSLYYSEKLITKKQMYDYENAIQELIERRKQLTDD